MKVQFCRDGIVKVDGRAAGTWRRDIEWFATVDFVEFAPRRTASELRKAIAVYLASRENKEA